jgi:hypothetical protein
MDPGVGDCKDPGQARKEAYPEGFRENANPIA